MKNHKGFRILVILVTLTLSGYSQEYLLNEDFSTASGTTPPANWQNIVITGQADCLWHFNNPGNRTISFPVTSPFTILDAPLVSPDTTTETVFLESPSFDASQGVFFLLFFDHYFFPDSAASAKIFAFNGTDWEEVTSFDSCTANPSSEVVDLTHAIAGSPDAKLRFQWTGHGKGYWAIDNISVYSALYLDAGTPAIDSPVMPFEAGVQDVKVTLKNFGYDTLTSATIKWTVNGVMQPSLHWNGTLLHGYSQPDINIGSYDFQAKTVYNIKVWSEMPNGMPDPNQHNDSLIDLMSATLCGNYTIGGADADFQSLGQAVDFLNNAGITCAVDFKLRSGAYTENVEINRIIGTSETNNVTFESETGDSSAAILQGTFTLKNTSNIILKKLRYNGCNLFNTKSIRILNCLLNGPVGVYDSSQNLIISRNNFDGGGSGIVLRNTLNNVQITGNLINNNSYSGNYVGIGAWGESHGLKIIGNDIRNMLGMHGQAYGISVNASDTVLIRNNVISNSDAGISLNGGPFIVEGNRISGNKIMRYDFYGIAASCSNSILANNYILCDNSYVTATGIQLNQCSNTTLAFNTSNIICNREKSKSIEVIGGHDLKIKNNIFSNSLDGFPACINTFPANSSMDYNDYYSPRNNIGTFNGTNYFTFNSWQEAITDESHGIFSCPFFEDDINVTPHQILLNNTGIPVPGIAYDIDSSMRNLTNPDIGAKEFSSCTVDAGINFIKEPTNPLVPGAQNIMVVLQNQGTSSLTSATINWQVNGSLQTPFQWTGFLDSGQNIEIVIGTYIFHSAVIYQIKSWTSNPNNGADCDNFNDTIESRIFYTKLCGNYTIGGEVADFQSLGQAVDFLNNAGITCAVDFKLRSGAYTENVEINRIIGTSETNNVTFESETGDSSAAILQGTFTLKNTSNIILKKLRYNGCNLFNTKSIRILNCLLNGPVGVYDSSQNLIISRNNFDGGGSGIVLRNTLNNVQITGNLINNNSYSGNYVGIGAWGESHGLKIIGNDIRNMLGMHGQAYGISVNASDTVLIRNNVISNSDAGISLNGGPFIVEGNRISGNKIMRYDFYGIAASCANSILANNYILCENSHITATGIQLNQCSNTTLAFNTINKKESNTASKTLEIIAGTNLSLKNNIFVNLSLGHNIYSTIDTDNNEWDYNNYFCTSDEIAWKNQIPYFSLSSWASAIGGEANGLNLNPYFLNDESYKVYQCGLNGAGIPIPGITDDIEGDLRSPLAPDIGCDEFDFPSYLFGFVFNDLNHNGIQDEGEPGLPSRLIAIEPGNIIAMTDSNGVWTGDYVPAGSYLATVHLPDNWQMSTPLSQPFFFMDTTTTTRIPAFGMYSTDVCPRAEVTVTAPRLVRCSPEQMVYVTAKNDVTATGVVIGSYVDVSLDPLLSLDSASLAYSSLGENRYRFDVGDLNPGEEVNFSLSTTVSCDALKDQTLCIQTNIYPVDSCAIDTTHTPPPPNGVMPCNLPWDHSSLSVEGWCDTDSVRFSVTNTGQPGHGDMVCNSPVRVYLDTVMVRFDSIQLPGGQIKYYAFQANGHTWRLEADQHPLHPGHSHPNAVVEACGDTANWTPGLINDFPLDDADPSVDIYCGMVTGDWQQAEKIGYPEGTGGEGNILPGQGIQYQVTSKMWALTRPVWSPSLTPST